jgi:hypothetical protein
MTIRMVSRKAYFVSVFYFGKRGTELKKVCFTDATDF